MEQLQTTTLTPCRRLPDSAAGVDASSSIVVSAVQPASNLQTEPVPEYALLIVGLNEPLGFRVNSAERFGVHLVSHVQS